MGNRSRHRSPVWPSTTLRLLPLSASKTVSILLTWREVCSDNNTCLLRAN